MVATIYCDASWCQQTQSAGVGYCLISQNSTHFGTSTGIMPDISHAELAACFMSISKCLALWPETKVICLSSDNKFVVNLLSGGNNKIINQGKPKMDMIFNEIIKMIEYSKVDLYVRHVMAHTGRDDQKSLINHRVDLLAKRAMKSMRIKQLKAVADAKRNSQVD